MGEGSAEGREEAREEGAEGGEGWGCGGGGGGFGGRDRESLGGHFGDFQRSHACYWVLVCKLEDFG